MAKTHFAAVLNNKVIGTRSSASRHVDGAGKFGPYTHAVVTQDLSGVLSWHGSELRAREAQGVFQRGSFHGCQVVTVLVTAKRLTNGQEGVA